jgi:hypothetical protein
LILLKDKESAHNDANNRLKHKTSKYHFEDLSQFVYSANERNQNQNAGEVANDADNLNSSITDNEEAFNETNFRKYIRMRSADDTGKNK